ncbi:MAG: hypothetical protein ACFFG0_33985 [Candidatus Thorarchaeota archaeon]
MVPTYEYPHRQISHIGIYQKFNVEKSGNFPASQFSPLHSPPIIPGSYSTRARNRVKKITDCLLSNYFI